MGGRSVNLLALPRQISAFAPFHTLPKCFFLANVSGLPTWWTTWSRCWNNTLTIWKSWWQKEHGSSTTKRRKQTPCFTTFYPSKRPRQWSTRMFHQESEMCQRRPVCLSQWQPLHIQVVSIKQTKLTTRPTKEGTKCSRSGKTTTWERPKENGRLSASRPRWYARGSWGGGGVPP